MRKANVSELKDRALDLMVVKLDEICGVLNSENENLIFYVKDNSIFIDCSDFSPRDVCILKI